MLIAFKCNFYFFSPSIVMPLSYGKYWEAMYEEGNEDEGILILHLITLLFLPLL